MQIPRSGRRLFPPRCSRAALSQLIALALVLPLQTAWAATAPSQQLRPLLTDGSKPITLEAIYGPEGRVNFRGTVASRMTWLDDGTHFLHRRDGVLQRVNAETDEAEPAYDHEALQAVLEAHDDFDESAAGRLARRPGTFNKDRSVVLVSHQRRLYLYRFADEQLTRITEQPGDFGNRQLSPTTGFVSFVRDNNLFTIDTQTGRQGQLTADGNETLLNGVLDWVYQEEVYGRGRYGAHWWRDDDAYVAYLQLDESQVPSFSIADQTPQHSKVERTNYPKSGDPNPTVRLGVIPATGGETVWVDLSKYGEIEFLIVRVAWAPDGRLIYQVQNREQQWLDLNAADPRSGESTTLIHEASPAWVNVLGQPDWLNDGSFLWFSERDGYRHLYHYTRDGKLNRRLTEGSWEVRRLHGVDPKTGWVYFSGTRDTTLESHAYRVKLDGGSVERLTEPGFTHRTQFDPQLRYFIDTFSNVSTPAKVHLRRSDASLVRVISENEIEELADYRLSTPQFLRIPARDGHLLNAMLILPHDYEAGRRYPVWSYTYGGPHAPSVRNRWGGNGAMLNQYLAQKGYIYWVCDPRSASGEGAVSAWQAYQQLGVLELSDLEDGIRWLVEQGYADPERVGIHGHSYGGFMTAYALTHSDVFSLGVASAPVTDWRNYDTIYTERYMRTPENNPEGYDGTSVVQGAKDLHGRLLVVHGALDDNVHFQNTLQFIFELQKHKKQFDLMVYPKDRHGIGRGGAHLREMRLKYILENL